MKRLVVALLLLPGCLSPTDTAVHLTAEQKREYHVQLQRRLPAWFSQLPAPPPRLPDVEAAWEGLRIIEFDPKPGSTCYFDPPHTIRIGSDKWASGCVPHELGHAFLYRINHPCWRVFEHPNGVAECQTKLAP